MSSANISNGEQKEIPVVGYIRESTIRQGLEGYRPDVQKERIQLYCDRNGFRVVRFFTDWGSGGSTEQRPNFLQMLDFVKSNGIRFIVIHETDRLFRNVQKTLNFETELETEHGIFAIDTVIDHNPREYLVAGMAPSIWGNRMQARVRAEEERRWIQSRVKQGYGKKREKRQYIGPLCYGIEWLPESHKYIRYKDEEKEVVKQIYDLYLTGKFGFTSLAKYINEGLNLKREVVMRSEAKQPDGSTYYKKELVMEKFTHDLVRKILTNRTYIGYQNTAEAKLVTLDKNESEIDLPPLIDEHLVFNPVQELILRKKNKKTTITKTSKQKRVYLFQGIVRNATCGCEMYAQAEKLSDGREVRRYICKGRKAGTCSEKSIRAEEVETHIIELLKELNFKETKEVEAELRKIIRATACEVGKDKDVSHDIAKSRKKLKSLESMLEDKYDWNIEQAIEKEKKALVLAKKAEKDPELVKYFDLLELRRVLKDLATSFNEMQDLAGKQELIRVLFDEIMLGKPRPEMLTEDEKMMHWVSTRQEDNYRDAEKLLSHLRRMTPSLFEEIQVSGEEGVNKPKVIFKPTGLFLLVTGGVKNPKKKA
ncbi:MAG: recombinase family protein [Patescibacteria group bacterium]